MKYKLLVASTVVVAVALSVYVHFRSLDELIAIQNTTIENSEPLDINEASNVISSTPPELSTEAEQ